MKTTISFSLCLLFLFNSCKIQKPFCTKNCCAVAELVQKGWIFDQVSSKRICLKNFTDSFEVSLNECSKSANIEQNDIEFLLGEPDTILPYAESLFKMMKSLKLPTNSEGMTLCYYCESERKYLAEDQSVLSAKRTYYILVDSKSKKFLGVYSTGLK